jgi:hypothetical protein
MSLTTYTPGTQNAPFGLPNTNPQSSQYGQESIYSPTEEILISKEIKKTIFDAAPEQYNALKLVFDKSFEEVGSDEFEFLEHTFGRQALEVQVGAAAQAAVVGAVQTQTITLTAASASQLAENLIITYPDNTKGIIRNIAGAVITVESYSNQGLPLVAVGDLFSIHGTIDADGRDVFDNYSRLDVVTRYNYIQLFGRAARWDRVELIKHQNMGTTDYLVKDKKERMRQLRTDLFVSFFNGTRGEVRLNDGSIAKAMGGVFPTMQAAGSMTANPTVANLKAAFELLAFATNHKKEGATRFIYGTAAMLHEIVKIFKEPGLRYAQNDTIANLNLFEYRFGGMVFVPVTCELFKEVSCFPKDWARRILVLDQEAITPIKLRGLPAMETWETPDPGQYGSKNRFKEWWMGANLSTRFDNPIGSFWIDVQ